MGKSNSVVVMLAIMVVFASVIPVMGEGNTPETNIRQVLLAQTAAWNRGDIPGFMEGYIKEERLRFASGGTITRGYEATLERYLTTYATPELMGHLSFSNLDIDVLSPDRAIVFGRFNLERASDHPWGLFTLLLEKTDDGWRIAADHTSSGN
jgi:ketosteroid isomerase-like protein